MNIKLMIAGALLALAVTFSNCGGGSSSPTDPPDPPIPPKLTLTMPFDGMSIEVNALIPCEYPKIDPPSGSTDGQILIDDMVNRPGELWEQGSAACGWVNGQDPNKLYLVFDQNSPIRFTTVGVHHITYRVWRVRRLVVEVTIAINVVPATG